MALQAFIIVVRFASESWSIEQASLKVLNNDILKFGFLQKPSQVTHELIRILGAQYDITSSEIEAVMRDYASVNNVAKRTLNFFYPVVLDVSCFSHTLNLVGDHYKLPNLLDFLNFIFFT